MTEVAPARPAAPAPRTAFDWPTPHFFRLAAEPSSGHSRSCVVEPVDGGSLHGDLLSFEPDSGFIDLQLAGGAGARKMEIEQIRMVKLTSPLVLVRDAALMHGIGASDAQVPDQVRFVATLNDGSTITGMTRGFVKKRSGLFLFLLQSDSHHAVGCFIPGWQLKNVHIGPPLGTTLAASGAISDKTLAIALDKQAKLREERLGSYLTSRAIVSAAELARALENQRRLPTVKLGEILLAEKLITPAQLEDALNVQRRNRTRRLGDILIEMGAVSVRTIQKTLSEKFGIPFVNVREFVIDPATLRLVPKAVAVRQQVLPLLRIEQTLVIAVDNPLSSDPGRDVRFITGLNVVPVLADPASLRVRIALEYATFESSPPDAPRDQAAAGAREAGEQHAEVNALAWQLAREAPPADSEDKNDARVSDNALVRLVNKIIIDAHTQGASDIHIENNPGKAFTRVRFRKDGDLEDYLELLPAYRNALVSRIKIMAGLDISEHRHAQDGKINFGRFGPLPIDLRVAVIPTANHLEDVVLRLLGGVEPLPITQLGLSVRDLAEIEQMVTRSYGLILVCGPTGSGKTTTLHSVLHHINRPDLKIWTAEDPVEITQPGLRQVQINARIGWTFANAMRAFLRADPDVIMVGEMRDAETTKIAIEASLTGHLVFSTLHTNSAAESVVRLLDLGMDPFNFADALIGVLSQRLARKLCPHCKKAREADDTELSGLAKEYCAGTRLDPAAVLGQWRQEFGHDGRIFLYEPVGCGNCSNGWRGRMGVYELLLASPAVKELIRSHGTVPQLVEAAQAGGMQMLKQDAWLKVLHGSLDLATVRAAAS